MSNETINILCLHGCNQTQEMFERLTKQMREIATTFCKSKNCDMKWHFMEAQYEHSNGGKTWYNIELDVSKIGTIEYDHDMVNPTLETLDVMINSLNIHVLLGFSQGGNVIDTYLVNRINPIKCAVIFSGYSLVDENRNNNCQTQIMNVYSDEDIIVPSKHMPIYINMTLKSHDKGHKLPTSKPYVREIIEYIYKNV